MLESKQAKLLWTLTCWFVFINLWCDLFLSMQIQYGALTMQWNINVEQLKLITSLCESDYNTRLAELQLPSLNYRRQRGDMI